MSITLGALTMKSMHVVLQPVLRRVGMAAAAAPDTSALVTPRRVTATAARWLTAAARIAAASAAATRCVPAAQCAPNERLQVSSNSCIPRSCSALFLMRLNAAGDACELVGPRARRPLRLGRTAHGGARSTQVGL